MVLPQLDDSPEFLSVAALAQLFDISLTTAYAWLRSGRLRSLRVGGVIRITRAEVERFVRQLEEEAAVRAS